jgi:hypothetical protein
LGGFAQEQSMLKIKITRHYVWVERMKRKDNSGIPLRTNSLWYRDMRHFVMWKNFLSWCFGWDENL